MNISLTPELEQYINDQVASGLYHSSSEVVREGLRLLKEHDTLREIQLNELRQQIQTGINSGESQPIDIIEDVIQRGQQRHTTRWQSRKPISK